MKDLGGRLYSRMPPWAQIALGKARGVRVFDPETFGHDAQAFDLVTFDAFDTLVTRPVAGPADVFLLCGHAMIRRGMTGMDPQAWHDLRCRAEDSLRESMGEREVTLEMIFERIAELVSDPTFDAKGALALETEAEIRLARPITETVRALSARVSSQSAILSDTYFPLDTMHAILEKTGLDLDRSPIVASCVAERTKRVGTLFGWYREKLGRANCSHLHVGDNLHADIRQAGKAGCSPVAYLSGAPNRIEQAIARNSIEPPVLRSAIAGSMRSARLRSGAATEHEKGVAEVGAGLCGPLLVAYVAWILRRAQALGIARLYFFSREGEILTKVADRLVKAHGLGIDIRYLYVSRQALHLPALEALGEEDVSSMNLRAPISALRVLAKLELPPGEETRAALVQAGYRGPVDDRELSEAELRELVAALRGPLLLPRLETQAALRRGELLDYLRQEEFFAEGRVGLVDIGWKGRLQRSIVTVARGVDPSVESRVHGFYFNLYNRPARSGGLEVYAADPARALTVSFIRAALFEVFCTARHGTTLHYRRGEDGRMHAVLASSENAEADAWGLAVQQEAIVAFTDDLLESVELAGLDLLAAGPALDAAAEIALVQVTGTPTRREAEALGSFPHPSDEPSHGSNQIAPPLPRSLGSWRRRWEHRHRHPLISDWPEGSIMRSFARPLGLVVVGSARKMASLRRFKTTKA